MRSILHEKNDIKIFILYLLDNVDYPLEYKDLGALGLQDGFVRGLDFAECFSELLETENIAQTEVTEYGEPLYEITEQGRRVAETLQSELLSYIRTQSLKSALRFVSFKKRGASISAEHNRRSDGRYDVVCKIVERGEEIFSVRLIADNIAQLEQIKLHFYDTPETIFRGVYALTTGEANYLLQ